MIKEIRQRFNSEFTQAKYEHFLKELKNVFHKEVVFRVPESPIFLDKNFKQKLIEGSEAIIDVICKPEFKNLTEKAIPDKYKVKNETDHSHFICIDWAICDDGNGGFIPQLIELQGFASLFAWEDVIGKMYKKFFYCPDSFTHYFSGLNSDSYHNLLKKVLVGNHAVENVVLMDIKPHEQKTRIDFYATEAALGISIICLSDIIQKEKKLFYKKDGKEIEIKRIYNRLIFDDLESNPDFTYSVNLFDNLDVEWVAHPNWFYRISKFTMPFLKTPFVPDTFFLNELKSIPEDLENYVLKPLFSFSGQGVLIDVTKEDVEKIIDKANWILQRKVQYAEALQSPEGGVKCEVRMMYLWPDGDARPTLATNLSRMSRGKMIGVRYNKDFTWVGGNISFFER